MLHHVTCRLRIPLVKIAMDMLLAAFNHALEDMCTVATSVMSEIPNLGFNTLQGISRFKGKMAFEMGLNNRVVLKITIEMRLQ
jgi:hypothetical protein